jgi:CubicO group peptidase (beta-lactamase class C family)
MAVLVLVDRGVLSLDDSLTSILPDFPAYGKGITVRHLLQHTSGLKDYEGLLPEDLKTPVLDADVLRALAAQDAVLFPPGSRYAYSNSGYAVLTMIVEARSGRRYAEFLHDEVFVPAGMTHSVAFENGRSEVSNRAYGYKKADDATWVFADQSMTSSVLGDGGVYTSLRDYAKWDAALYTEKIIRRPLLEQAMTPGKLSDGTPMTYGFGWNSEEKLGQRVLWHTGSTTGFNHAVRRIPALHQCVVVFANRVGTEPKRLCSEIEDLVLTQFPPAK